MALLVQCYQLLQVLDVKLLSADLVVEVQEVDAAGHLERKKLVKTKVGIEVPKAKRLIRDLYSLGHLQLKRGALILIEESKLF